MAIGTPAQQRLTKKFFDPFFNWDDDGKLRDWLHQQDPDELEQFLNWFNFSSRRDREMLGRQELAKLRANADEAPPAYTVDAAKAVYAAIQTLVSAGKRAYSLSVPIEAQNILIKQEGGRIGRADASRDIKAAILGLSRDGKIDAYAEGHKDWLIKKPLAEEPEGNNVFPVTTEGARPSERRSDVLILKPTLWGVGIDLNEAWRRVTSWFQKW